MTGRTFLILSILVSSVVFLLTLGGAIYGTATLRETRVQPEELNRWRRQALRALERDQLASAELLSEKVLRHRPNDAVIRANLGRVYGRYATQQERGSAIYRAIAEHKLAIASRPELPDLYYNVACYYARAGDVDLAFDWLAQSIARGFGRMSLLETDEDLAELRKDPRFELMKKGERVPSREPTVRARLTHDRVKIGESVTLQIIIQRFLPPDSSADLEPAVVDWKDSAVFKEIRRTENQRTEEAVGGWTRVTTTVEIEIETDTDGLFAVPAATVRIGESMYKTDALVLTVER